MASAMLEEGTWYRGLAGLSEWDLPIVLIFASITVLIGLSFSQGCSRTVTSSKTGLTPESVNYHFTRSCNYKCGFCFHTETSSYVLPLDEQKRGLKLLRDAGMRKLNLSGGEPFLVDRGKRVGELVVYCKEQLHLESVTIVTNGSLVTEKWFELYGASLDILAVSCDSFDQATNERIGRRHKGNDHLESLRRVVEWCHTYGVLFKLNTVVNTYNKDEDMSEAILGLGEICRWKVFKVLPIVGENVGSNAKRQVDEFLISDADFTTFVDRHRAAGLDKIIVDEDNEKMQNSYLILDERMRFLDCTSGAKEPSLSLLDVGVPDAICESGFDAQMFLKRGGKYKWSKSESNLDW